jgi:hypothetical protein
VEKFGADPLYQLFEQHLLNALVEEESTEEFVNRVVQDYIAGFGEHALISRQHLPMVQDDLREEVMEMLRKKTYGHYSLKEFRKAQAAQRQTRSRRPM